MASRWWMRGVLPRLFPQGTKRPADGGQSAQQRGGSAQRSRWAGAAADRGPSLAAEYGWPGMAHRGWLERWRRHGATAPEPHGAQVTWGSRLPPARTPAGRIAHVVRGPGASEHGIHRVRDVRYAADRFPGRTLGIVLAGMRNAAITRLRKQA